MTFLFMAIASFFGWHFDVVPTGSMRPVYNPGGLVVTRPAKAEEINIGDPILFLQPLAEEKAFICHRVIDIEYISNQPFFQTKGDANEYPDSDLVSPQNLVGKTILYIPHVGKIAYISRLHEEPITFMGKRVSIAFLLIVVIALTVIGMEVKNISEWLLMPASKKRQERLKKQKERLLKRKKVFKIA